MACLPCRVLGHLGQYGLNWLNLADHALSTLLLGDADETVSKRVARARKAGRAWAVTACGLLTGAIKLVTLGRVTRDHCDLALDPAETTNSREIWDWSTGRIRPRPISTVETMDVPGADA